MADVHKGGTGTTAEPEGDGEGRGPIEYVQDWRDGIRERPKTYRLYRIGVGVVGGGIVIGGLALVPLPGPGWVIVFVGLAILATEFVWARRLENFARRQVKRWTDWLGRQGWPVKILVGLATAAFVLAIFYAMFRVLGLPSWTPDTVLPYLPGLTKS